MTDKDFCTYLFYGFIIFIVICIIITMAENNDRFTIHKNIVKAHLRCSKIANYPQDLSCVSDNKDIKFYLEYQNYIVTDWNKQILDSIKIHMSIMKRDRKTWRKYKHTDDFKSLQKFLEQGTKTKHSKEIT